jgi:sRNA-binding protein
LKPTKKYIYAIDRADGGTLDFRCLANGKYRLSSDRPLSIRQIHNEGRLSGKAHHWSKTASTAKTEVFQPEAAAPILPTPVIMVSEPSYDVSEVEKESEKAESSMPSTLAQEKSPVSDPDNIEVGDRIEIKIMGTIHEAKILETFEAENEIKVKISGTGEQLVVPADWFIRKI